MREVRPSFFAFLISFVVVAIAWAGHRDLFSQIRRTDRALVCLNVLYLLPFCIMPSGAPLLSRYQSDPVALRMYGILLMAIAGLRLIIWTYATGRSHLPFAPMDARSRWTGAIFAAVRVSPTRSRSRSLGPPTASLVIYAAVPTVYFGAITLARSSAPPGSAERDFTWRLRCSTDDPSEARRTLPLVRRFASSCAPRAAPAPRLRPARRPCRCSASVRPRPRLPSACPVPVPRPSRPFPLSLRGGTADSGDTRG